MSIVFIVGKFAGFRIETKADKVFFRIVIGWFAFWFIKRDLEIMIENMVAHQRAINSKGEKDAYYN